MRRANKAAFTSRRYRELMQNTRFECYKHLDPNPSEDVAICPHHHAFYEIIFVVEGDFFYEVEGRPYHLSHGDVILIDELQFHHGLIYHSKGYERYALWIHPKYMQRLAKRFPKLDPQYCFLQLNSDNNNIIHLDDATFAQLQQDLSALFESFWSKTPSDEVLSESYFAIILTKLNQIVHRQQQRGEEIPTISAQGSHISNVSAYPVSNDMSIVYQSSHSLQDAANFNVVEGQTLSDHYNNLSNIAKAQIVDHAPKFSPVQSMHEMIAKVHPVIKAPERTVSLNGHSLLPSNIASTGKDETITPFGYVSVCPMSGRCHKHAFFNELLLSCIDTDTNLVSFAPNVGDTYIPSADVSIFDPDPELDNVPESKGSFQDIYTDSFTYDDDKKDIDHKKATKLAPCQQGPRERTGHDFQTLIMQGEGEAPAPILSDGAMPGFNIPIEEDEMHLNLKLSESLKLSALLKFINLNINENLSLDEISQRFNLSKFYLTRRFKELTGLSLHQFIVKKRLTRARYLISVGIDPYRAAVEAGFNNYSHFSRTFKGYFGQNPSTIPQAKAIHIKRDHSETPESTAVDQDIRLRD